MFSIDSKLLTCLKNKHRYKLTFLLQVVKAFVVLSAPFKSSNPEKLTLELQDHVKKSTAPYKYPRKASIFCPKVKCVTKQGSKLLST